MKKVQTVLLIEDDKDDQDFFVEALSKIDTATLYGIANNGREAMDQLEHALILPDMIFMDINMPFMNGLECLAALHNNPLLKNIPVVMLSTSSNEMEITRALGAKAFIKKTSDGKTLRELVSKMINLDFIADSIIANLTFKPVRFSF